LAWASSWPASTTSVRWTRTAWRRRACWGCRGRCGGECRIERGGGEKTAAAVPDLPPLQPSAHPSPLPSLALPIYRSTWDILCAQWLLGRAFGHFIGAKHPATVALTNAAFPAAVALAARSAAAAGTAFNLLTCAQSLLGVLAAATAAKLGLEGAHSLPDLGAGRVRKAAACIGAGVAVFPLPERWPGAYWACHSAWHLLMGAGLHELYLALEGEPPARIGAGVAAAVAGVAAAPGRAARAVWGGGAGPAPAAAGAPHALAGAGGAKAGGGRAGGGAVRHHLHAWAASGRLMMGGGAGAGGLLPAAPPPPPAAGAGAGAALEGWAGAAAGLAASSLRAVAAAAGLSSSDGSDADGSRRSSGERSAKPGRRRSVRQAAAAARR